jgi:26S proteasome regulatory subunit T4
MDGFDSLGRVKLIMATNRPDTLDPALLRPGRLDRKIEIPLPNDQARLEILKIHAGPVNKSGEIDYEAIVKLSDGFNGADLRNVITEAGMFAIRDDREYIIQEDLAKAARKVAEAKKHESQYLCFNYGGCLLIFYLQRRWTTARSKRFLHICKLSWYTLFLLSIADTHK